MYRVFILSFLAIASSIFAIDSSYTILQAKSIADKSVWLQWTPVVWASEYKVYYDESKLLVSDGSEPLFNTETIQKTDTYIGDLNSNTEYTFFVHAFDADNREISKSLPVHIKTFQSSSFSPVGDPAILDAHTLQLSFTRPIDTKKIQITVVDSLTQKNLPIDTIKLANEDLRIVHVTVWESFEMGVSYDVTFKKISTQAGTELASEYKKHIKVVYGGDVILVDNVSEETLSENIAPLENTVLENASVDSLVSPVPTDHLPKTGPTQLLFCLLCSVMAALFFQKKLSKRA
jgi:hypothetical protein